jgi:hypothetical protein
MREYQLRGTLLVAWGYSHVLHETDWLAGHQNKAYPFGFLLPWQRNFSTPASHTVF